MLYGGRSNKCRTATDDCPPKTTERNSFTSLQAEAAHLPQHHMLIVFESNKNSPTQIRSSTRKRTHTTHVSHIIFCDSISVCDRMADCLSDDILDL